MAGKKKSTFKNISENIGVKQRVFIAVMVIASAGTIGATYFGFSSLGEKPSSASTDGVAKSQISLGAQSTEKAKVGDAINYDPKSPMAEKVRQARKKKIEEAQAEEGAGYMDPVNLSDNSTAEPEYDPLDALINGTNEKAFEELQNEKNRAPVVTGIDDTVNLSAREAKRQKKIAEMTNKFEESKRLPGTQYEYRNRYGDELTSDFMQNELGKYSALQSSVSNKAIEDHARTGSYSSGGTSSSGQNSDRPSNSSKGRSSGIRNDPYFSSVTRDRTADAQPDIESTRRINQMVQSQVGSMYGSGGKGQIGGFGEEDSESSNASNLADYEGFGPSSSQDNKPIKASGDVCYGQLGMPVNSDAPTPVTATILDYSCGPLRGAKLIAKPERNGAYVTLTFTSMNYKGRTISVNAMALDAESKEGIMADDVNRHIVSRYLSLAVAAGLPGWADSVRSTEKTTDENGEETVITEKVSGKEQIAVITGAIADTLVPAMQQNFNRPPTVKLYSGKPILIMFMGDLVIDKNIQ